MTKIWYAHGKLLLTGEYLILGGAVGLATPVQFGQDLRVSLEKDAVQGETPTLCYKQYFGRTCLLEARFNADASEILFSTHLPKAQYLQKVLLRGRTLNPTFLSKPQPLLATSRLTFDASWGLGSSANFLVNIARWIEVDPFLLAEGLTKGSGYDIACAMSENPILYWRDSQGPHYTTIDFKPSFRDKLFFVYSGNKVHSETAIQGFMNHIHYTSQDVEFMSKLTYEIASATSLDVFERLIEKHEAYLSTLLKRPTVKSLYFKDFTGAVKSLGAWGGDFLLATHYEPAKGYEYFKSKGLTTIFPYNAMVYYSES